MSQRAAAAATNEGRLVFFRYKSVMPKSRIALYQQAEALKRTRTSWRKLLLLSPMVVVAHCWPRSIDVATRLNLAFCLHVTFTKQLSSSRVTVPHSGGGFGGLVAMLLLRKL